MTTRNECFLKQISDLKHKTRKYRNSYTMRSETTYIGFIIFIFSEREHFE